MDGSTPSSGVVSPQRLRDFRVCAKNNNSSNDSQETPADARRNSWGAAPIYFRYSMETNYPLVSLSLWEKDSIPTIEQGDRPKQDFEDVRLTPPPPARLASPCASFLFLHKSMFL